MNYLKIGDGVKRINCPDSANGRTGNIIAILDDRDRYQIQWFYESDGRAVINSGGGLGVKTKVRAKELMKLDQSVDPSAAKKVFAEIKAGREVRQNGHRLVDDQNNKDF